MQTMAELQRKLSVSQSWEKIQVQRLRAKGLGWIDQHTDSLELWRWPEEHKTTYMMDVLSHLACRRIRFEKMCGGEQEVLIYVRAHTRAAGLEKALQWLEEFRKEVVEYTSPTRLLQSVVMMPATLSADCDCATDGGDTWWHDPVLIWIHENHRLYNQAMWEIMASQPGLLRRLRRALRDDLSAPDRTIGDDNHVYGRHLVKVYANQLLTFITPQPDPVWIAAQAA